MIIFLQKAVTGRLARPTVRNSCWPFRQLGKIRRQQKVIPHHS